MKIEPGKRYYAHGCYVEKQLGKRYCIDIVAHCYFEADAVRLARKLNRLDRLEAKLRASKKAAEAGAKNSA